MDADAREMARGIGTPKTTTYYKEWGEVRWESERRGVMCVEKKSQNGPSQCSPFRTLCHLNPRAQARAI